MPALSVAGLRKSFGGLTAISNLDWAVEDGEFLGVIGPNGAGKTTLFHLISGFLRPDSGSIRFKDQELKGKRPHEIVNLGIARTFQIVKSFSGMTARETLWIPLLSPRVARRELSRQGTDERVRRLADSLGLAAKLDERVENLNAGELRLLDIGRALATDPEVLLLDEPFSGLAHADVQHVSEVLQELRQKGLTVIIIEHRLRELMKLVGKVMVIHFGEKIAEGRPEQIVRDLRVIEAYLGDQGESSGVAADLGP